MPYKVFLVEDEIVTREGIRDNVNWEASGCRFCGEAADGELALPLLDASRPDVLITDIRMPFMDGLQLSKIVHERMPQTKIVILSGHDEFEYAQAAIKLGVTEYLLKPVSAEDMHGVLRRVVAQIERERKEHADLAALQSQVASGRAALQEALLLKLVMGAVSAAEAIEQGQALGVELIARWYMVAVIQYGLGALADDAPRTRVLCERVQRIVAAATGNNPDVFVLRKNQAEIVLVLKGHVAEYLVEEAEYLLTAIRRQAQAAGCAVAIGAGTPKPHLGDLYRSFAEALYTVQGDGNAGPAGIHTGGDGQARGRSGNLAAHAAAERDELLKVDKLAVNNFLRYGSQEGVDAFLDEYVCPFRADAQRSPLMKNYLLLDIVVAAAQFVHELGGDIDAVVPDLSTVEELLAASRTVAQILPPAGAVLHAALAFRDSHLNEPHAALMRRVKQYLAQHYGDPDLSLHEVARQINLSPSHFSMVFGQEAGTTFRSYLTEIRMRRAKELLRTTTLRPSEVAAAVGYHDPHYFSFVFRKQTELTPTEFRTQRPAGPGAPAS